MRGSLPAHSTCTQHHHYVNSLRRAQPKSRLLPGQLSPPLMVHKVWGQTRSWTKSIGGGGGDNISVQAAETASQLAHVVHFERAGAAFLYLHWSHTQEPSSSHAAASTFKVCARKRNLLILRITCLDRSRWRYRGT
jgi:hypothetical protein